MAAAQDGYEWALSRVTEMEVDLASAITGLKRSQADNESLLASQSDLMGAYKRLQEHHERVRRQLHQEQEERQQIADEQQQQVALWRSQLELRDRDLEELQHRQVNRREIEHIRFQLEEEIEERYRLQFRDLEDRLEDERERSVEARRQAEGQRLEHKHMEQEMREQMTELAHRHEMREQALQSQISTLEGEVRTQMDAAAGTWNLRMQMQEQEAKLIGLNTALQEQESTSSQERKTLGDRLLAQSEELSMARRRINELQVDIDSRERVHEQAVAEAQAVGREQVRLTAQLAEARAQLASARPSADFEALSEELAQVKRTAATEHDQMSRRATVAEDQVQAMQLAAKHAEAKIRQLQEERTDRERELQGECAEMERTHAAEIAKLRAEVDKSSSEAETRRLAWREKERELMRQIESASSREEAFKDDFDQCRLSQEEAERRLQEIRRDAQLRACTAAEEHQKQCASLQAELSTLRERVSTLERERNESVSAADVARTALKTQEQRSDALQTELASVSQRLDAERSQWSREADEANVAAIRLDEEHRKTATQQLAEDHKRQMNKLNSSYKKTLQKAARKRQEMKHRCQELVKRITVLQQEKALAIRICEENKNTFESRLAELGLVSRLGLGSVGIGAADVVGVSSSTVLRADAANDGMMHRRELRAIMERLEQNAEKLQVSVPPASETVSATS